jgi:tRNA threonylcarbamoyladenosine biosynthesis protein TsaB
MSSLRQLLAAHSPILMLDAASSQIQVGDGADHWENSAEEAGVGVFQAVQKLGVRLEQVQSFVFCDGPGSVLGIRTTAMAIRTWCVLQNRPVYSYSSLALMAHSIGRPELGVIADARRDAWHHYQIGTGLRRLPAAQVQGELVMPEGFRHWSALPGAVSTMPYRLHELLPRVVDVDLFLATDAPDAFLHEEPSYVTWTPQIHRAPVP